MPDTRSEAVKQIAAIADPVDRAAAAQRFLLNGRRTIRYVEGVRDDAIRAARALPARLTVDELATRIKAGRYVVVDATRRGRGEKP